MRHNYIDAHSNINSFIHRLDPRIKIITFAAFILFIIFTPPISFATFALYGLIIGILILLSRIPLKFILRRSLAVIPFVLLISISIPFIKQGEVAGGYSLGALKLTVTYHGLLVFWNVSVKAYLSILCMILLMASTRFSELLKALETLKVPILITMVLSFMYRYIFVIQDELMMMERARQSRFIGASRWFHIQAFANMIGVLFIRAYERAESVYLAMCSRAFTGRVNTINKLRIRKRDLAFLITVILSLSTIKLITR